MGEILFPEVLIHGIMRDALGKDEQVFGQRYRPLELIDKYGADALRFSLCMGVAPGSDIRFSEDKMEPARNFLNKIWNASRYELSNREEQETARFGLFLLVGYADKWTFQG